MIERIITSWKSTLIFLLLTGVITSFIWFDKLGDTESVILYTVSLAFLFMKDETLIKIIPSIKSMLKL